MGNDKEIPKRVYCRGCNREVEVKEVMAEYYKEEDGKKTAFHPIIDCDERR